MSTRLHLVTSGSARFSIERKSMSPSTVALPPIPLAAAISTTAVRASPRMPNAASTFISGRGPATDCVKICPPVAATSAATVP
jgi:hypothetical protein